MKKLILAALLTGTATMGAIAPSFAKDLGDSVLSKERFQIRVRGIGVLPDGGGNTTIGGSPEPDDAFVPEVDITYFMTENWALELIADLHMTSN